MILVDTSVWVDHLRKEDPELSPLLANKQVLIHPFVIGEILIGSVRHRDRLESRLNALIQTKIVSDMEVNFFVRTHEIFGRGIGFIDAHLLVSAKLTGVSLMTRDKRLHAVATELGLA